MEKTSPYVAVAYALALDGEPYIRLFTFLAKDDQIANSIATTFSESIFPEHAYCRQGAQTLRVPGIIEERQPDGTTKRCRIFVVEE